jgi:glycosyltransferase involved in cell wall biosynthesis
MSVANKPTVFLFGKLPPPYMGPSIATELLLRSALNDEFKLIHIDTRINSSLSTMGKFSLKKLIGQFKVYVNLISKLIRLKPALAWIPISQSKGGFAKDAILILLCRFLGTRVLIHLRGSEFRDRMENGSSLNLKFVRFVLGKTSGVIVLGERLKSIFLGWIPEDRIYVCPNGGDFSIPEKPLSTDDTIRLLYIGNLQPGKGVDDLLQAFCLLPEPIKSRTELTLLGAWRDTETRQRCTELIQTKGLRVLVYGQHESGRKFELLSKADLFVFPPRDPEGHPWVIVEAMAAGLPVITTDRGAIAESVEDGYNGYIVPLNSPVELAGGIAELSQNPEKRKRMGAASRKRYLERFTEQAMVTQLNRIIHTVIERPKCNN